MSRDLFGEAAESATVGPVPGQERTPPHVLRPNRNQFELRPSDLESLFPDD